MDTEILAQVLALVFGQVQGPAEALRLLRGEAMDRREVWEARRLRHGRVHPSCFDGEALARRREARLSATSRNLSASSRCAAPT
jgi:hypothetical protein